MPPMSPCLLCVACTANCGANQGYEKYLLIFCLNDHTGGFRRVMPSDSKNPVVPLRSERRLTRFVTKGLVATVRRDCDVKGRIGPKGTRLFGWLNAPSVYKFHASSKPHRSGLGSNISRPPLLHSMLQPLSQNRSCPQPPHRLAVQVFALRCGQCFGRGSQESP
ncbi:hypothetical protein CA13_69750 [Planctomycetes bacterium CA13]|uniref:Uncharacterized protein n=1 Tax=Novipirellula herctigrandis TaxID=2527986 RepID=A0A5C5YNG7_9BACT|nr:hypothetical protein CA13_69750 [Planctomycetes bacterium CA13]